MASTGVFGLTRFTALAAGDVIPAVDVSDATQSAHGSLDAITVTNFFATVPVPIVVTSASANAFAVGLTGATNSAFLVDASTASQVAGLKVTGAATGGTVAIVTTDSGAATNLTINANGTGTIGIGSVSTGRVTITPVTTITGVLTLSAQPVLSSLTASQAVFTDGSKGLVSNAITGSGNVVMSASPTLTGTITLVAATASGLITANAGLTVASGQTLTVTGATITGLTAASVATGTFPGVYTVTGALTLSAALTYGGVTLSNAVTGTGNMVLSASPTLTGTLTAAAANFSGNVNIAGSLSNASDAVSVTASGAWPVLKLGASNFGNPVAANTTLGSETAVNFFKASNQALTMGLSGGAQMWISVAGSASNGFAIYTMGDSTTLPSKAFDITSGGNTTVSKGTFTVGSGLTVTNAGAVSGITTLATSNRITVTGGGIVVTGGSSITGSLDSLTTLTMNGLLDNSGASGGQFKFPATQNASSNANTLDDYQEQSWSPSIGGSATYGSQSGRYIKIGKTVFFWGNLQITSRGTGSTGTVSGLPVASATGQFQMFPIGYFSTLSVNTAFLAGSIASGASSFTIIGQAAVDSSSETVSPIQDGTILYFSGQYEAAA